MCSSADFAAGVSAYVTAQHFFKGCNTLGAACAILFAFGAIAGEAHRGTLYLDEVADMPLSTQARILRVLTELHQRGRTVILAGNQHQHGLGEVTGEQEDQLLEIGVQRAVQALLQPQVHPHTG